ncbi:MAG: hypothetical protein AAB597_02565, partial [Patescibacteria group bacterium]
MERSSGVREDLRFSSPEEELVYLREQVKKKEAALSGIGKETNRAEVIREEVEKYGARPPHEVLAENHAFLPGQAEAIVLDLAPKSTDGKIEELLGILSEKGIRNALSVAEKLNDPQILDDFHRFLVQYIGKHFSVPDSKRESTLLRTLDVTLFEVTLPPKPEAKDSGTQQTRSLKELLSGMEQLYSGLMSVAEEKDMRPVTLEIAVPEGTREVIFYAAVPNIHRELFEKQFTAVFPEGKLIAEPNDYNIFTAHPYVAGSVATYKSSPAYPIKRYTDFENDPLSVLVSAFSKIKTDGEGAAFQVVFMPAKGKAYVEKYRRALDDIKKGIKVSHALNIPETFIGDIGKSVKELIVDTKKKKTDDSPVSEKQNMAEEAIRRKIESQIVEVNLRAVASAENMGRAEDILGGLESAFNQFEDTKGNSLKFIRVSKGRVHELAREFSFRLWNKSESLPVSLQELVGIFHFPSATRQR